MRSYHEPCGHYESPPASYYTIRPNHAHVFQAVDAVGDHAGRHPDPTSRFPVRQASVRSEHADYTQVHVVERAAPSRLALTQVLLVTDFSALPRALQGLVRAPVRQELHEAQLVDAPQLALSYGKGRSLYS